MGKIVLDVSVFSEEWFKYKCLPELLKSAHVKFVFTSHAKLMREMKRCEDFLRLFKNLESDSRRIVISEDDCDVEIVFLAENATWTKNHKLCDDPHIFSMCKIENVPFVISSDTRMARCRDCLKGNLKNEYTTFVVIASEAVYSTHRAKIRSR